MTLQLRRRLALLEQLGDLTACLLHQSEPGVGVDAHRGRHVGVSADLLDRLEINAGLRQRRDVAVPEDVGRGPEHIDLLFKIPQQPAGHHQRGRLLAADDVSGLQMRHQEIRKLVVQRNHALSTLCLGGRDGWVGWWCRTQPG